MGYTTYFKGKFTFSRSLTVKEHRTLTKFSQDRHESDKYPSIWCDWVPDEDGNALQHNENEKFYCYVEWLKYLIEHYFNPWGVTLSGSVTWKGEERSDVGVITIKNNIVTVESR